MHARIRMATHDLIVIGASAGGVEAISSIVRRKRSPRACRAAPSPPSTSIMSCPYEESGILRFRCRVGHVYSPDSMMAAQTDSVDRALWVALRALEERAALTRRLAERARSRDQRWVAGVFEERANAAAEQADLVRQLLADRSASHIVPDSTDDGPAAADEDLQTARTQDDQN